jgi:hypothetical protein
MKLSDAKIAVYSKTDMAITNRVYFTKGHPKKSLKGAVQIRKEQGRLHLTEQVLQMIAAIRILQDQEIWTNSALRPRVRQKLALHRDSLNRSTQESGLIVRHRNS